MRRDGLRVEVSAADLVLGDVVLLEAGDRISADLRLLTAAELAVDESLLTGESLPVRPAAGSRVYAGTFVTEGEAEAVVDAVGADTRLAGIAALTRERRRPGSPLAIRLNRLVLVVAVIAVAVGTVFFGLALVLGTPARDGFLFAIGVTVALVPEGLLPTVTLSLARAAQRMAGRNALVRRLESVETLGSTTFICTDKTGTLTRNEMSVVRVWTPVGSAAVHGAGYDPAGAVEGSPAVLAAVGELAAAAVRCSTGRLRHRDGRWVPQGDPMEVALHVLALRAGVDVPAGEGDLTRRYPFDPHRRRMSMEAADLLLVKGAPAPTLLATASGAAFTAVVLGQLGNAFACRSTTRWVGRTGWRGNPLLLAAVAVELLLLTAFLTVAAITHALGGRLPTTLGWATALAAVPTVLLADAAHKAYKAGRRRVSYLDLGAADDARGSSGTFGSGPARAGREA